MTGAYERIAESLLKSMPKAPRKNAVINGRLVLGTASMHHTKQAMTWRTFWRIKTVRVG